MHYFIVGALHSLCVVAAEGDVSVVVATMACFGFLNHFLLRQSGDALPGFKIPMCRGCSSVKWLPRHNPFCSAAFETPRDCDSWAMLACIEENGWIAYARLLTDRFATNSLWGCIIRLYKHDTPWSFVIVVNGNFAWIVAVCVPLICCFANDRYWRGAIVNYAPSDSNGAATTSFEVGRFAIEIGSCYNGTTQAISRELFSTYSGMTERRMSALLIPQSWGCKVHLYIIDTFRYIFNIS